MREISFGWTTPALVSGHKTVTRRDWNDDYAHRFHAGDFITALDRQRRYKGQPVGVIKLTAEPELQQTDDAPATDYVAEGLLYLEQLKTKVDGLTPQELWRAWRKKPRFLWVVRFELVRLSPYGEELRGRYPVNTASQLAMLPGAVKVGPNGRAEGDFYSTPPDCLRDLLSAWDPDPAPHSILEPAAGAGALLAPLRERWPAATIDAYDIQPRHDAVGQRDVWSGDLSRTWDLVITNPPYSKAREFVDAHWLLAERYLVLLLKLAFFESIERRGWWRKRMPAHVYVLSHRPSFRNGASEPRTAYAWFVWTPRRRVRRTVLEVL